MGVNEGVSGVPILTHLLFCELFSKKKGSKTKK